MLPLHDPAGTGRPCGIRDGAIVGFFVVAISGEGVRDSGQGGFDELVIDGVVEALGWTCQHVAAHDRNGGSESEHTGPVKVELDLDDHVPTMSAGSVWAVVDVKTLSPAAASARMRSMVVMGQVRGCRHRKGSVVQLVGEGVSEGVSEKVLVCMCLGRIEGRRSLSSSPPVRVWKLSWRGCY